MKIATKVVYVAGPYSAPTAWQREENIRRAEAVALELWGRGIPALCVHTIARYFHGAVPEQAAIDIDNALLDRCDAIQLVEGWPASPGTRAEIDRARAAGKPVFLAGEIDNCVEWAHAEEEEAA